MQRKALILGLNYPKAIVVSLFLKINVPECGVQVYQYLHSKMFIQLQIACLIADGGHQVTDLFRFPLGCWRELMRLLKPGEPVWWSGSRPTFSQARPSHQRLLSY
jgi:hypothetical protein